MRKFELPASAATLTHEISGDVGGNSQITVIEVRGGQFPTAKVREIGDGFRIEIYGTWESGEFISALTRCADEHGSWEVNEVAKDRTHAHP